MKILLYFFPTFIIIVFSSIASAQTVVNSPNVEIQTSEESTDEPLFIIGAGGGWHQFSNIDEVREDQDERFEQNNDVDFAFVTDYFIELYLSSRWSIGFRYVGLRSRRTQVDVAEDESNDENWLIENRYLTTTFLFADSSESNFGVNLGTGTVDYRYSENSKDGNDLEFNYDRQNNRIGITYIAGLFFDTGGRGLGFRVGVNYIQTDIDDLEIERENEGRFLPRLDRAADGSGYNFIINFRWGI